MAIHRDDRFKAIRRPVSSRTRMKMGSPVRQTKPVQYPQQWLPLTFGQRENKILKVVKCLTPPSVRAKEGGAENDSDGLGRRQRIAKRRFSGLALDNDLFRLEQSHRARQQNASISKRLKTSLIQLVEFKTRKNKKRPIKRHRATTRIRIPDRRDTKRRNVEGRLVRRRKVMRGRTRRRRVTLRRRVVRRRRRRTRLAPKKRRRRKRSASAESYQRRGEPNPGPSLSHENDQMLFEKAKVVVGNLDEGHDEVKDDPLNVNDICRTLVKSMHGMPADCREVITKEKNEKPELQRDKKEETQKYRRRKPVRIKRRRSKRADKNKNVSNNRKQHSRSRRVDKKSPKRRKKGEDSGVNKSGENGISNVVKKVNDKGGKDEEETTKDLNQVNKSHFTAASHQAMHKRRGEKSHLKSRSSTGVHVAEKSRLKKDSSTTVDNSESSHSQPHCSHQSLYKNRSKKPHTRREESAARRAKKRKTTSVRQGRKNKKSTNRSNSGRNPQKYKSDRNVERYEPQGNRNNNQETDVRWYRVGGRLKRVTQILVTRLKQFFVK